MENSTTDPPRVVITGLGMVTPLGLDVPSSWNGMIGGRSGIGPLTRFKAADFRSRVAGQVDDFDPEAHFDRRTARRLDRFSQFARVAAEEALSQSRLDLEETDRSRGIVLLGSALGGVTTLLHQQAVLEERGSDRVNPFTMAMVLSDMAAGQLSIHHGLQGLNAGYVSACATGTDCVGRALRVLQRGEADFALAGASEAAITPLIVAGFASAQALTTRDCPADRSSCPFDRERDGFVIAEGAGVLVLETEEFATRRGARPLARIAGYGASSDAFHITQPCEKAGGATRAMKDALGEARLTPEEIGYVNAHGTSTVLNDKRETLALKQVFGEHASRLAVSSTKSMIGHALGAAGAIESIVCVLVLTEGILPPTINLHHPDPDCDLDYLPLTSRERTVSHVLTNSMGFGGHNASLVFSRFPEASSDEEPAP